MKKKLEIVISIITSHEQRWFIEFRKHKKRIEKGVQIFKKRKCLLATSGRVYEKIAHLLSVMQCQII